MAELEQAYGQPVYDPESRWEIQEEDNVTISGIIKTWDGRKVSRDSSLTIHYNRNFSSGHIGISPSIGDDRQNVRRWNGDTGEFWNRNSYGSISVSVIASGYAPGYAGPFLMEPGQVKDDIEIMLEEGYTAYIQVIDADTQQPVENVQMKGSYLFEPGYYSYRIKLNTDENGIAVIENATDVNITLQAMADGYQQAKFENQTLSEDTTLVLQMQRAVPVEGKVISEATGQPIQGAEVRIQCTSGETNTILDRDYGELLAVTDENGHFALNQLNNETRYVMSVKADGYAYGFTDEIVSGDNDIVVELSEPILIKGKVIGPLDKLPVKDGKSYIPYNCVFNWDNHSNVETTQHAYINISDSEAVFVLTDLWGNRVNFGMGHWRKTVRFNETIPDEVILDLNRPLTDDGKEYHKRTLILEFETSEKMPTPTGNIRLNYMDPEHSSTTYKGKLVEIIDGQAVAEIIAPGKISYAIGDTIGCWFKEDSGIEIDNGTEPLIINVKTVPAGMIFGEVFEADGSPASNTMVSYNVSKKSDLLDKNTYSLGVEGKNRSSQSELETKYSISPLPLEGEYRIIAHRNASFVVSDKIKLTEKEPIHQVNITFPEDITLSGQILLPDGTPARGIEYGLHFEVVDGHSFSRNEKYTDADGLILFENINPDAKGVYKLEIKSKKDYRPIRMELKDMNRPINIRMEEGAVVTGQIIDKTTGWPIPNVEVRAYCHYYQQDKYNSYEQIEAESRTDKDGRFRFSNMMANREYHLTTNGCKQDGAGFSVIGGETCDEVFEVTPYDWSDLKPIQPKED